MFRRALSKLAFSTTQNDREGPVLTSDSTPVRGFSGIAFDSAEVHPPPTAPTTPAKPRRPQAVTDQRSGGAQVT